MASVALQATLLPRFRPMMPKRLGEAADVTEGRRAQTPAFLHRPR